MQISSLVDTILVPQGSEYNSVRQGLSRVNSSTPSVVAIPIGPAPLTKYLENLLQVRHFWQHPQPKVLLMGLCGSLTPSYSVGEIVLYQSCIYGSNASTSLQYCDLELTNTLHKRLPERVASVRALTSDRLIYTATEKRHLGQLYNTSVVDMEGFATLEMLNRAGVAVAMLRVISDDCDHNLPDLSLALSSDGSLQSLPLAISLLKQPIAAARLIRGGLKGLQVLRKVTTCLFAQ